MVWNSEKVDKYLDAFQKGVHQGPNPFWEKDPCWKKGELNYKWTVEELKEIKRCQESILYFADKYCFAMTDDGIQKINLRDYQKDILSDYQNHRFNVFLSPRQAGKCVSFLTECDVYFKSLDLYQTLPFFKIYFKYKTKKTIYDYIKYGLYNLIYKIEKNGKEETSSMY